MRDEAEPPTTTTMTTNYYNNYHDTVLEVRPVPEEGSEEVPAAAPDPALRNQRHFFCPSSGWESAVCWLDQRRSERYHKQTILMCTGKRGSQVKTFALIWNYIIWMHRNVCFCRVHNWLLPLVCTSRRKFWVFLLKFLACNMIFILYRSGCGRHHQDPDDHQGQQGRLGAGGQQRRGEGGRGQHHDLQPRYRDQHHQPAQWGDHRSEWEGWRLPTQRNSINHIIVYSVTTRSRAQCWAQPRWGPSLKLGSLVTTQRCHKGK